MNINLHHTSSWIRQYVIVIIFILASCAEDDQFTSKESYINNNTIELQIDPDRSEDIKFSNIFDSIQYIPLETTDEVIISAVSKIVFHNDLIYILDNKSLTIWIFDTEGKYQGSLFKKGRGPGEYISIFDFNIIQDNNVLAIWDRTGRKMLFYDLQGNFIREKKINLMAISFFPLNEKSMWFFTKGNDLSLKNPQEKLGFNLFFLQNFKIIQGYFPYNKNTDNLFFQNAFYYDSFSEKLLFRYAFFPEIHSLSKDGEVVTEYLFDFGDHNIPFDKYIDQPIDLLPSYACLYYFAQGKDFLYTTYIHESRLKFILYFFRDREIVNGRTLINDTDGLNLLYDEPKAIINNNFIFVKDAYQILNKVEQQPLIKDLQFNSSIKDLTITSNPILISAHLKEKIEL